MHLICTYTLYVYTYIYAFFAGAYTYITCVRACTYITCVRVYIYLYIININLRTCIDFDARLNAIYIKDFSAQGQQKNKKKKND